VGVSWCSARSRRPTAVLIRPDGHVAWVADGTDRGLRDALAAWFGPPHHGDPTYVGCRQGVHIVHTARDFGSKAAASEEEREKSWR